MTLALAMAKAGMIDPATAQAVEAQAERKARLRSRKAEVARVLLKAQETGRSEDWERYTRLRSRLPRQLRFSC